jgi:hypothetical protein
MKLTIGMSCYDDYDGVWFTIQSILMYHSECIDDINFVVIDGNPESSHGKACEQLISKLKNKHGNNGLYVKNVSWPGTASRDYIFQYAKTPYVLVVDSHVQIVPGAIKKLIKYYDKQPDCKNLIHGPLLGDDGNIFATEMSPEWDYNMYGKWLINPDRLKSNKEYEIEIMGLGLFSCARSNWLGFNKKFRGFGGEEGYIHKKYKKAGHKSVVLPWLKWNHRFTRPRGVPYQNEYIDRVKNYLIGWDELGEDTTDIIDYYSTDNTQPGQERVAINESDLLVLQDKLSQTKLYSQAPDAMAEESRQLRARVIELEMKLMEMAFSPEPTKVKEMDLNEYIQQTEQSSASSLVEPVNTIKAIEDSFKQKLVQKPQVESSPEPVAQASNNEK